MREEGGGQVNRAVQVVIGVDTHQDEHVAVAIDGQGVRLGERRSPGRLPGDMGTWSNGPGAWERLARSELKARAPTVLDFPGT